jgi:hypothetical protein
MAIEHPPLMLILPLESFKTSMCHVGLVEGTTFLENHRTKIHDFKILGPASAVEQGFSVATWMCITLTKGESILHCSPSFWEHTAPESSRTYVCYPGIHIEKDVEHPWFPIWTMIYIGGVSHLYIIYIYIIYI